MIARGEDECLFAMGFAEAAYFVEAAQQRLTAGDASEVLVCLARIND